MGDNKKWFKVWNSILTDPSFLDLPIDQLGRWTLLGALISLHGENGKITLSKDALYKLLRVTNDNSLMLPNVVFEEGQSDNATITVIMKNWLKYQLDSTGYKRLKKFRKSKMITVQEKTKRRLREDKNKPFIFPLKIGEFKNIILSDPEKAKVSEEEIRNLSLYLESTGKKYKSHYATILNWRRKNQSPGTIPQEKKESPFAKCPKCSQETTKQDLQKLGSCPSCYKPATPEKIKELLGGLK